MLQHRYPELDLLRTVALSAMILYHTAYDLAAFYGFQIDVLSGGWWLLARSTATLFLLLVGISFVISWDRTPTDQRTRKYWQRGCLLLAVAMMVSLATLVFDASSYVRFGILHLIATSILVLPFFMRFTFWNAPLGVLCILIGQFIPPPHFTTIDHFSPLPWFGVILLGTALGDLLYIRWIAWRKYCSSLFAHRLSLIALSWPSRHSLLIYLVHQPIMLLLLKLVFSL